MWAASSYTWWEETNSLMYLIYLSHIPLSYTSLIYLIYLYTWWEETNSLILTIRHVIEEKKLNLGRSILVNHNAIMISVNYL